MHKLTVLLVALFLYHVQGAPEEPLVPIIAESNVLESDGSYKYSFEAGNGIKVHEEGTVELHGEESVETVTGEYEYPAPDGTHISIKYNADETGFHAFGDSIPVAPPVPDLIAKSLEYLKTHPQEAEPAK